VSDYNNELFLSKKPIKGSLTLFPKTRNQKYPHCLTLVVSRNGLENDLHKPN